jgi:type I restriction enzyme, R subunit
MGGFPDASTLYARYRFFRSIEPDEIPLVEQPYYPDNPGKEARYNQVEAINRAANSLRG